MRIPEEPPVRFALAAKQDVVGHVGQIHRDLTVVGVLIREPGKLLGVGLRHMVIEVRIGIRRGGKEGGRVQHRVTGDFDRLPHFSLGLGRESEHGETVGEDASFHRHLDPLYEPGDIEILAHQLLYPRRTRFEGETREIGARIGQGVHIFLGQDIGADPVRKGDLDPQIPAVQQVAESHHP